MEEQDPVRIRTSFEPNMISLVKHKSVQGADRQYKFAQLINQTPGAKQNNILEVKQAVDADKQYNYSLEKVYNCMTLRQYLSTEEYKKLDMAGRLECVYKFMPGIVKSAKFIQEKHPNEQFIVSPEKVLIQNSNVKVSIVAFHEQDTIYDPLYSGIPKQNSTIWSLAMLCDQILRCKPDPQRLAQHQYTPPQTKDRNLQQFLHKILSDNQTITYQQLQHLFQHPRDQLLCSTHFKKIIKVDIANNYLLCEDCLKEQFYEWEYEKAESRRAMDGLIQNYKQMNKQFERVLGLARGENQELAKRLKGYIENGVKGYKEEYREYVEGLQWRKMSPVEESAEISKVAEKLEQVREQLTEKYIKKIKKQFTDEVRSQILK